MTGSVNHPSHYAHAAWTETPEIEKGDPKMAFARFSDLVAEQNLPPDTPQVGGTWEPRVRDGKRTARIACPGCGLVATLDPGDHQIDALGNVTPSVDCPACEFHKTITLHGWTP